MALSGAMLGPVTLLMASAQARISSQSDCLPIKGMSCLR